MRSGQTWLAGSTYPCSLIPVSTFQKLLRRDGEPMPIGAFPRTPARTDRSRPKIGG